jgi:nitrite reductase (NADH) small subunit
MSEWHVIADVDEIPPGTGKELVAGGRVVALYNVEGAFHALDGVCPHAGGPIGKGELTGCVVTCPWHGWQFDVTTGRHCLNESLVHTQFETKVVEKQVHVAIP